MLIPKPLIDGDDELVMFQLKQGLFVEANLKDKDIFFNERCLYAMGNSSNADVIDFLARYRDSLEALAGGHGENIGFIRYFLKLKFLKKTIKTKILLKSYSNLLIWFVSPNYQI